MDVREPRISSEAVEAATGRSWGAWRGRLDEWGARELDHREIVALVRDRGAVESGWWQQMVANGAHVTAVDGAGKLGMLRSLGADEVVDYTRADFTRRGVRYDLIVMGAGDHRLPEGVPLK